MMEFLFTNANEPLEIQFVNYKEKIELTYMSAFKA